MTDRATNETTLRRLIDVFWNEHRLETFTEFFAEDAVLHSGTTDHAGTDGLSEGYAGAFMAAFPDLRHEIEFLLIDGDMAAMRFHGTGTLAQDYGDLTADGQELDYHGTAIFRMHAGRIAEVWSHSDLAEWVAAQ